MIELFVSNVAEEIHHLVIIAMIIGFCQDMTVRIVGCNLNIKLTLLSTFLFLNYHNNCEILGI